MSSELYDSLVLKLRVLNDEIWENRVRSEHVDAWLANFADDVDAQPSERLHALYLLSQFMYFGSREVRALLAALYRDVFKYPIVESIRRGASDTVDQVLISSAFRDELLRTRFVGVGNPSESGQHLLYYFRQENSLPKSLFINAYELFEAETSTSQRVRDESVRRYVFLDDFCGSGDQAKEYSKNLIAQLKTLQPRASAYYYSLFGTHAGLNVVRSETLFDRVAAVVELDDSYKTFHSESRYFAKAPSAINAAFAAEFCARYGEMLFPGDSLGYRDGQLLLGFMHNVPDNSLPIMWAGSTVARAWTPIFRRYPKLELVNP